jgi:hypothetical protein
VLGFDIYIPRRVIGHRLGLLGLENINRGGPYKWPASVNRAISGAVSFIITTSVNGFCEAVSCNRLD